uniref:Uncharacterized protein n=1 Tax=Setaria italica TaxID=4555 RepID=K3Z1U2_SETIT
MRAKKMAFLADRLNLVDTLDKRFIYLLFRLD